MLLSFQNALLEFARVVKAQEQVVSGTLHHLTLEVIESGKKKLYEAKGWVKPWMNFKELQEFKHVGDDPSCASSDLGVKKGSWPSIWCLSLYLNRICGLLKIYLFL